MKKKKVNEKQYLKIFEVYHGVSIFHYHFHYIYTLCDAFLYGYNVNQSFRIASLLCSIKEVANQLLWSIYECNSW